MRNEDHCHFWRKRGKETKRQIYVEERQRDEGKRIQAENGGVSGQYQINWSYFKAFLNLLTPSSTHIGRFWFMALRVMQVWCPYMCMVFVGFCKWLCESSSPSLQASDRQQSTWKTTSAVWLQAQQHIKDRNKSKKLIMYNVLSRIPPQVCRANKETIQVKKKYSRA